VPVTLYAKRTPLAALLWRYKNADPPRAVDRRPLAALLAAFVGHHGACLEAVAGQWDALTTVPSRRRPSLLDALVREAAVGPLVELLVPSGGAITRRGVFPSAFRVAAAVPPTVLLVDDTCTSGAHVHSAAAALKQAGARTVVAVPLGRIIDPSFGATTALRWAAQRSLPYDIGRCPLCAGSGDDDGDAEAQQREPVAGGVRGAVHGLVCAEDGGARGRGPEAEDLRAAHDHARRVRQGAEDAGGRDGDR